jgi:hypothetical protein
MWSKEHGVHACRIGEDTMFMGVLEPIPTPIDRAALWLRMDGCVVLACSTFEDWLGYSAKEVQGISVANLVTGGLKEMHQ